MNKWLTKFAQQSVDADDLKVTFERHLYDSYTSTKAKDIIKKIDWTTWIQGPGLPPWTANFTTAAENLALKLANDYISLGGNSSPLGFEKYKTWPNNQRWIFQNQLLLQKDKLTQKIVQKVNDDLDPYNSPKVSKIQNTWLRVGILSGYYTAPFQLADDYLGSHGIIGIVEIYLAIKSKSPSDASRIY